MKDKRSMQDKIHAILTNGWTIVEGGIFLALLAIVCSK